jgi:hypothetical protein
VDSEQSVFDSRLTQAAVSAVAALNAGQQDGFAGFHRVNKPLGKITRAAGVANGQDDRFGLAVAGQIAVGNAENVEVKTVDISILLLLFGEFAVFNGDLLGGLAGTIRPVGEIFEIDLLNAALRKARRLRVRGSEKR